MSDRIQTVSERLSAHLEDQAQRNAGAKYAKFGGSLRRAMNELWPAPRWCNDDMRQCMTAYLGDGPWPNKILDVERRQVVEKLVCTVQDVERIDQQLRGETP